jgi:hypothetical protein
MAKPTPRRGASPRAAAKSKKVAVVAETEDGDIVSGSTIDAGIAIFTTIVLIAALVLVDKLQGLNGDGILF